MNALVPLVRGSSLTVSFNFDDFLERSLAYKNKEGGRGFETVTDPWPQFRRTNSVVYHPHGFVPSGIMEGAVDRFVFSEAGYSKQYVGANGHDSSFLTAHFARNTCLLIGCSLEGELRTVLMRGAQMNPGNYHYYVHHLSGDVPLNDEERSLIAETNFKVYNLNTLFLSSVQIALLLQVINPETISDQALRDDASLCFGGQGVALKYTYYLTGPIGVGKSTTANLLRSLTVLDEWHEARPSDLAKPWDTLTEDERVRTDEWIAGQFKLKNTVLRHNQGPVISVVDRPPLDPLIFAKTEDRAAKSKSLLEAICPSGQIEIEKGVVILLLGIPEELSARVVATGRQEYTADKLLDMQEKLVDIYGGRPGVITIIAKFLSIPELTRRVAQIIHRDEYQPADLMEMMRLHQQPLQPSVQQVASHDSA
jgi:SIR2-like domain